MSATSKACMRAAPAMAITRCELQIEEMSTDTIINCQLYYTPKEGYQSIEHLGESPVAPVEPKTLSPPRRLVGQAVQMRSDREKQYFSELTQYEADKKVYLEKIRSRKSQLPTPDLIFAHGNGNGLNNHTVAAFAEGFARIAPVLCFNGDNNMLRRSKAFRALADQIPDATVMGGKGMGACVSARMPLFSTVRKLVFLGYPLIRHSEDRDEGLLALDSTTDVLFVVGDADPSCPDDTLKAARARIKARSWCIKVKMDHALQLDDAVAQKHVSNVLGQLAARWNTKRDPSLTEMNIKLVDQRAEWDDWHLPAEAVKDVTT